MDGLHLDLTEPYWEAEGETDFPKLFIGLFDLVPQDAILYFEGGWPTDELLAFLEENSIPEQAHVAYGTIWPRPLIFHVPAIPNNLRSLSDLMQVRASSELAIHFHVYRDGKVLLEWHDAFSEPLLISANLPPDAISKFCEQTGLKSKYCTS